MNAENIYLCDFEKDKRNKGWVRACAYGSISAMKDARNVTSSSIRRQYLTISLEHVPEEELPESTYCFVLDGEGHTHYKLLKDFQTDDAFFVLIKKQTLFNFATMGCHNRSVLLGTLLNQGETES